MSMRWLTAGESHGPALTAIVEGLPAHIEVSTSDIDFHLARRRLGVGRGARQNFEADKVSILGGTVLSGLELLLYQGIHQLEIVLDRKLDDPQFADILRSTLGKARS